MKQFKLHRQNSSAVTIISDIFLDKYMPEANGEFVKIYLHLLRVHKSESVELSIASIADRFNHTETDVLRALKYWEKNNLLKLTFDSNQFLSDIEILNCFGDDLLDEPAVMQEVSQSVAIPDSEITTQPFSVVSDFSIPEKTTYSSEKLQQFLEQLEIKQLFFIAEQYLGKTLSTTEMNTLLYFYDGLHFSIDLIEYLLEYCISNSHKSFRYIETVAIAWAREQIETVLQAKSSTSSFNKNYYTVMNAFGIKGRNPVKSERNYVDLWMKEYGLNLDVIAEACNRTVEQIHTPSFEYADTILQKWKKLNVKKPSDISRLDEQHAQKKVMLSQQKKPIVPSNKFNNFTPNQYDYKQLEKELLSQS